MNKYIERIYNGILKENPTFIFMLGMCPTLAVTTSASNGVGMGLTTTAVLVGSNILISALRKIIPDRMRIPAFIVMIASLVTIVQLVLQAELPDLYKSLGIYIPLIVVNCIILGRGEAYASKNGVLLSACDGIGMGLGFTVGLTCIGAIRELLGAGSIFGFNIIPETFHISIFVLAPGAFFVLAALTALQNKFKLPSATNVDVVAPTNGLTCNGNCMNCSGHTCQANHGLIEAQKAAIKAEEERIAAEKKAAALKAAAEKKAAAAAAGTTTEKSLEERKAEALRIAAEKKAAKLAAQKAAEQGGNE